MADQDKEHDPGWDDQARLVDRLIRKLRHGGPALASAPGARSASAAPQFGRPGIDARPVPRAGSGHAAVWAQVGLALIFGVALTQWPYARTCDWSLLFYLLAVVILIMAGVWAAVSAWNRRVGIAHLLALGTILLGLVLAADEVLPRIGYAKTSATWMCAAVVGGSAVSAADQQHG